MAMLIAGVILLASAQGASAGGVQPVSDVHVRAAFLLNVANFVRWPDASRPLVIGVVGDDPLASALSQMTKRRSIDGRSIEVRTMGAAEWPGGCDVVYVGNLNDQDAAAFLARMEGPVLSVGLTTRFLRDGGIMRIFIEGERMRFQVNRRRAADVGLQLSSQLLSLAAQ